MSPLTDIILSLAIIVMTVTVAKTLCHHRTIEQRLLATTRDISWLREQLSVLAEQGKVPLLPSSTEVYAHRYHENFGKAPGDHRAGRLMRSDGSQVVEVGERDKSSGTPLPESETTSEPERAE